KNMDQTERDLIEQATLLSTREEYIAWEQRCDEFIESLEEQSRIKRPRLSIGNRQSLIARIARLEGLKDSVRDRFVQVGAGYSAGLRWREIETAFESRILTGAVINSNHIEPRQFLEDASEIVLERVRDVMQRHNSVKINTVFNGEFVLGVKRANKSVSTRNYELFRSSDLQEWYASRVVEPILASLDEFQEHDSGWTLSRILNLTISVNKYNPLHAGCDIELSKKITDKRAIVNVQSLDDACFAWSVVAALHPAKKHTERTSSYPHYSSVLNLTNIEFPMTLNQIKRFENLNDISVNVYCIENEILPLRLSDRKRSKHVNLLYVEDNVGHFVLIKDLSRLVIELNTKFRTLAKNDFEKNLYKLMNNAVFGKTMENVRDRVDVKLLTKWVGRYGAEAMIAKPNFHSSSIFSENLVAIELRKLEVKFDKPIYVGMCILDISKTCLYEFHHEYMAPLFRENCKIMYTDTDSLIYHVECDDVYEIIKRDINRFDTSDYAVDNAYGIPLVNKKVPGLMKDENNGAIMSEFVGLRAKMYALRVQGKKDTKKAKGIKSNVVARSITFEDYTRCLNDTIEMTRKQSCIRSKLHEVYTISETKIALSPHDDK
ncbi:hypothetical protein ALC62_07057, partial [Cyphomyrmex costatus]